MVKTKEIKKRRVVKIQHFVYCPNKGCDKEIIGNAANQVRHNLMEHMKKCDKGDQNER